jgi:two-component system chemotaxis response regulator CheB
MHYQLVIIGCSLGGLNAMRIFLSGLDKRHNIPIVLVQHRDKSPLSSLCNTLQRSTQLIVEEVDDGRNIEGGHLYIAPPGYHLLIEGKGFSLSTDLPVHHAIPSIDVAFETASRSYGDKMVAIVMTSSSTDGADGAGMVEARGGCVVIQDPLTAENSTLPRAAIAATKAARVVKLDDIAGVLGEILTAQGGPNARRTPR